MMGYLASTVLRCAGKLLSPAGARARLSILIYHRVLTEPDPLRPSEVDAATFSWQVKALREHFNVLPLGDAIERLRAGTLPDRAASVTFDDGYADNYHVALPILLQYKVPATFFVATGYLNGGCMWNDAIIEAIRVATGDSIQLGESGCSMLPVRTHAEKRAAISAVISHFKYQKISARHEGADRFIRELGASTPEDLMMTSSEVKSLAEAGMEIGGHTVRHPILSTLAWADGEREIRAGKTQLESIVDAEVRLFAYPNGRRGKDYTREHVDVVRKLGFLGAVSTDAGVSRGADSGYELARFTPWDRTPDRFVARLVRNCASAAIFDSTR